MSVRRRSAGGVGTARARHGVASKPVASARNSLRSIDAALNGKAAPMERALGSEAVGAQRREPVEADRGVARRVGAGRQDLDLVADLQIQRQLVLGALVKDV